MTVRKAKEILSNESALPPGRPILKEEWAAAKAFLEYHEKIQPLIEALKKVNEEIESDQIPLSTFSKLLLKEALSTYVEVLGE